MILDDLFNQAAPDSKTYKFISVQVVVTSNQTLGFKSYNTNKGSVEGPVSLTYTPTNESGRPPRMFPAFFSNGSITITEPNPLLHNENYEVQIAGKSFVAAVDATTSIIYGAAGSAFCTISICNYLASSGPGSS
jgi:hypothetical protein